MMTIVRMRVVPTRGGKVRKHLRNNWLRGRVPGLAVVYPYVRKGTSESGPSACLSARRLASVASWLVCQPCHAIFEKTFDPLIHKAPTDPHCGSDVGERYAIG